MVTRTILLPSPFISQIPVRRPLRSNRSNAIRLPSGDITGSPSNTPVGSDVSWRIEPPLASIEKMLLDVPSYPPLPMGNATSKTIRSPVGDQAGSWSRPVATLLSLLRPVPLGSIEKMLPSSHRSPLLPHPARPH